MYAIRSYYAFSYWYMCGSTWGKTHGYDWIPLDVQTSAEWMVQYLDKFFVDNTSGIGEVRPAYWEVINEPDMKLNTGQFMVSSWELLWQYHNLVAQGIKARLGSKAPKIGGMTWGLHDPSGVDLNRYRTVGYSDAYYGNTAGDQVMKDLARAATQSRNNFV